MHVITSPANSMDPPYRYADRLRTFARAAGISVSLAGLLVLAGWLLGFSTLTRPFLGVASMKPNTALAFTWAGLSLRFAAKRAGSYAVAALIGSAVGVLALATFSQDIFGWNLGLDQLLFRDATTTGVAAGRMAPMTALCFVAFAAGVLALTGRLAWLSQTLAAAMGLTAAVACISYLYDVRALDGVGAYTTMAVHTALMHCLLACGLLFARPTSGFMAVVASDSLAGTMARRIVPVATITPIIFGWLSLKGQWIGLYSTEFATSLLVMSMIVTLGTVIWWGAASLLRVEQERARVREELRVREAQTRAVLDLALDGVISIDAEGRIIYWNRRAEAIFGWASEEVLGHSVAEVVMPVRYREAHKLGLQRFLATGEGKIIGHRIQIAGLRRDGTEFPVELAVVALTQEGRPWFSAFVADITERQRAEEGLRDTEQQQASLLRLAKDLERAQSFSEVLAAALDELKEVSEYRTIWTFLLSRDGAEASLITIQGTAADAVEESFPTIPVKGDPYLEQVFAADAPVVVEDAQTDPRTNKEIVTALGNRTIINVPIQLADQQRGVFGTGTFGAEGIKAPDAHRLDYISAMASRVAAAFDRIRLLSDRQHALDELRALNAELEERVENRTAELDAVAKELEAFSYSVSHDLRAPLRHVTGFAGLLEAHAGGQLDERSRTYLRTMTEATTRMGKLIDDLLAFSRMGRSPLTKRRISFSELVQDARREVIAQNAAANRNIEWRVADLPDIEGDPAMLRLVMINLLSNAVKYSANRTTACIEIGANGDCPNEVVIFVRDNGVGFDMQYAGKLFGVFQRLHRSDEFEGTGIGLANVRRIIHRHGGRVWAESEVDSGATFSFSLPVGRETNDPLPRSRDERSAPS